MPKPFTTWTVLPHGQLYAIDENILTVKGDLPMPIGDFPRRMTVVRLRDGRLVVYSAIALDEDEMRAVEAFGEPSFLIVPNDLHRLDARIWKERYPALVVLAPPNARAKVSEVLAVDATSMDFGDPDVSLVPIAGLDDHELALVVRTPSGTTLVVNDLIWNVDDRPGFGGWVYKVIGATGSEPKIPPVVKLRAVKDKLALRAQLEAWAAMRGLNRIVVSHGDIVGSDASAVLTRLARDLAA